MNVGKKDFWKISSTITMTAVLLLLSTTSVFAHAPTHENKVFSPNSHPYGLSYAQWSTEWWKRAFSLTDAQFNNSNDCSINQYGPIWFLNGTTGSSAARNCIIPQGKAILFPIFNAEESISEAQSAPCLVPSFPTGTSDIALRQCAVAQINHTTALSAELDGKPIQNLRKFLFISPPFNFFAVNGNAFGISAGLNRSVSAGYWIILNPLAPGFHTLSFSGTATFPELPPRPFVFTSTVTYNLLVLGKTQ